MEYLLKFSKSFFSSLLTGIFFQESSTFKLTVGGWSDTGILSFISPGGPRSGSDGCPPYNNELNIPPPT